MGWERGSCVRATGWRRAAARYLYGYGTCNRLDTAKASEQGRHRALGDRAGGVRGVPDGDLGGEETARPLLTSGYFATEAISPVDPDRSGIRATR